MTYYCADCVVNWSPHQCKGGACPRCGSGTARRLHEVISPEADDLYRAVIADERKRHTHQQFEEFYAERESRLCGLDQLPVTTERRAA